MPLTDTACRQAKGRDKPYKMTDGGGLYLHVMPDGRKYWRMAYRFEGKQKTLAIGVYPAVSLADARRIQAEAKTALKDGADPSAAKKEARKGQEASVTTFEAVAKEWYDRQKPKWAERYAALILSRLEADVFPQIGSLPIGDIKPMEALAVIQRIERRGAIEMARRVKQSIAQVYAYAIITERAVTNPVSALTGALAPKPRVHHHKAMAIQDLPAFLQALDAYEGEALTRLALWLVMLTFVRTSELREARWSEIDLEAAVWRIPQERMKMRRDHIVPLSSQAVSAFRQARDWSASPTFVFPSPAAGKVMSNNTMLYALYRMGYHSRATTHGFRAMASTWLNENGYHPDWIEAQLAHAPKNEVRAAYNRASYLDQRRRMMQDWADFLDSQRPSPAV